MVLPLCTQTTLYMTGSLRSWIHYIDLRSKQDTQLEHREIAIAIKDIISNEYPNVSEALNWNINSEQCNDTCNHFTHDHSHGHYMNVLDPSAQ